MMEIVHDIAPGAKLFFATGADPTTLDAEAQEIFAEINREAAIGGLETGNTDLAFSVYVGTGNSKVDTSNATVAGTITAADTDTLFGGASIDLTTAGTAATAVDDIATAVANLGTTQGAVGTLENRLQFAISLAQSQVVNTKAAESRIRDANIAEESANMTRYSILNQAGIASLAQANSSSSAVLSLLR